MRVCSSSWKAIILSGAITLVGSAGPLIGSASAAAPVTLSSIVSISPSSVQVAGLAIAGANCTTPTLSQPFLAWNDTRWYSLVTGEAPDQFNGAGWTLVGSASVQPATVLDGTASTVLDLPAGGIAISPPICVASNYPTARAIERGTPGSRVEVGAVYADTIGPGVTENVLQTRMSGSFPGGAQWAPSPAIQIHPGNQSGWQIVQFVFLNASASGDAKLYDFYVDPRFSN